MALRKAVKEAAKLRMAIIGPAGSGKTFTALRLATVLAAGKPIALFDTEHGSAAKYAGDFEFDTDNLKPPFHPDKFVAAISEAASSGYGVVILDSLSHAWSGEGGLLDIVEMIAKRMKNPNSFAAWKDATPIQNRLTDAIVGADIHVIVTMRSKTEYVLSADNNGRQTPRKVGMAPVQRDQFDYEFDVVMEMDAENNGIITKTRCSALTGGVYAKPGKEVGLILANWLNDGPSPVAQPVHRGASTSQDAPDDNPFDEVGFMDDAPAGTTKATVAATLPRVDRAQLNRLHAIGASVHGDNWGEQRHKLVMEITAGHASSSNDLTPGEANELMLTMLGHAAFNGEWEGKADLVCKNAGVDALRKLNQADVNKLITRLENAIAGKAAGVPVTVGK